MPVLYVLCLFYIWSGSIGFSHGKPFPKTEEPGFPLRANKSINICQHQSTSEITTERFVGVVCWLNETERDGVSACESGEMK